MLDFRGIMQVQNIVRLPLEDVYVPLRGPLEPRNVHTVLSDFADALDIVDEHVELLAIDGRTRESNRDKGRPLGHDDLHTLVRDLPFLAVLGDPGAGKSTLVRYLMLALAEGRARERLGLEDEWLPILFPVAAFAEERGKQRRDLAPLDYLSDYYQGLSQPDYGMLFRRALLVRPRASSVRRAGRGARGPTRNRQVPGGVCARVGRAWQPLPGHQPDRQATRTRRWTIGCSLARPFSRSMMTISACLRTAGAWPSSEPAPPICPATRPSPQRNSSGGLMLGPPRFSRRCLPHQM